MAAKKKTKPSTSAALSFEQAAAELEAIIERIESGEIGLEESLAQRKRGEELLKRCRAVLDQAEQVTVTIKGERIRGLSRTFHDDPGSSGKSLLVLIGSQGYLEVARRDGSAALALSAQVGEPVSVTLYP